MGAEVEVDGVGLQKERQSRQAPNCSAQSRRLRLSLEVVSRIAVLVFAIRNSYQFANHLNSHDRTPLRSELFKPANLFLGALQRSAALALRWHGGLCWQFAIRTNSQSYVIRAFAQPFAIPIFANLPT